MLRSRRTPAVGRRFSADVVRGLVRETVDALCHRGERLGEFRRRGGGPDRAVPVDEVRVEAAPVAGGVVLWPQIGPEDGFNVGVIEEVGVLGLDDRLAGGAPGPVSQAWVLDGDVE